MKEIRIASNALVALAGPAGSGKSTWAARWFTPDQIVSSDALRAVVGQGETDMRASADAFAVLDDVVARRLKRGLLTVVDTLGMDTKNNDRWLALARDAGRAAHFVCIDTAEKEAKRRNRTRSRTVPTKAVTAQWAKWNDVRSALGAGYDEVHSIGDDPPSVAIVATRVAATMGGASQTDRPRAMRFGLMVSAFDWGDEVTIAERLGAIAVEAEQAGFSSLWVMDHFIQIPQVGREWDPMLDSWTTLGFMAARTHSIRLGTLVTGITYRNVAHLAKIAATLDVLSEGRAMCGLGAAWFEREHTAYGFDFPPLAERYELLEDALELLPLMWGSGAPPYDGRRISVPETLCYPRPIQASIPIMVGGSGEKKTLRLVARHADACNLFGEPDEVARLVEVLHGHCETEGRDPNEVSVTNLSNTLCAPTRAELDQRLDTLNHGGLSHRDLADRTNAGTTEDLIGRYRAYAEAGVDEAIVSLADVGLSDSVANFAGVIEAFSLS